MYTARAHSLLIAVEQQSFVTFALQTDCIRVLGMVNHLGNLSNYVKFNFLFFHYFVLFSVVLIKGDGRFG